MKKNNVCPEAGKAEKRTISPVTDPPSFKVHAAQPDGRF